MSSVCAAPASLPQELIDKVIDELPTAPSIGALRPESRAALVSCSLVSHSFRPRTIRHLFRRFNPANMDPILESGGWERLDEMLSESPLIARSFTSIVLQNKGTPPTECRGQAVHIMSLLVHVKSVEIWETALAHWEPTISGILPNITEAHFISVPLESFDTLRLPSLKTLTLSLASVDRLLSAASMPLLQNFDERPAPLALRHLETLHIDYAYFKWLCDSIPLGMPQIQVITVRFSGPYRSTTLSRFKLFDDLATTYLPGLKSLRLEKYMEKSQSAIISECPGLVARGILQWGVKRELRKVSGG